MEARPAVQRELDRGVVSQRVAARTHRPGTHLVGKQPPRTPSRRSREWSGNRGATSMEHLIPLRAIWTMSGGCIPRIRAARMRAVGSLCCSASAGGRRIWLCQFLEKGSSAGFHRRGQRRETPHHDLQIQLTRPARMRHIQEWRDSHPSPRVLPRRV